LPKASVHNLKGKKVGSIELSENIFGREPNEAVVHQAAVRLLANSRSGSAATKTRSEVRGGGRKPWRQKGTGRARQGTTRAPQWKGGGIVFGPHPRSYKQDLPQKVRRLALASALSSKLKDGQLKILKELVLPEISTKGMLEVLDQLELSGRILLVLPEKENIIQRSSSNLPNVKLVTADELNVIDLMRCDTVVMTKGAVEAVEARS